MTLTLSVMLLLTTLTLVLRETARGGDDNSAPKTLETFAAEWLPDEVPREVASYRFTETDLKRGCDGIPATAANVLGLPWPRC